MNNSPPLPQPGGRTTTTSRGVAHVSPGGNGAPKLLLTANEAAAALSICPKTLWSHSAPRGTIPVVRIGARVLYDPRDLQTWIEAQKERGDAP